MTTATNFQNNRYPLTKLGNAVEYSVTAFERGDALHVSTAIIVNGHIVHDTVRNGRCSVGDVIRESQIIEACGNDTLHAFTNHLALKWHGNAIRAGRKALAGNTQAEQDKEARLAQIHRDMANDILFTSVSVEEQASRRNDSLGKSRKQGFNKR